MNKPKRTNAIANYYTLAKKLRGTISNLLRTKVRSVVQCGEFTMRVCVTLFNCPLRPTIWSIWCQWRDRGCIHGRIK